MSQPVFEDIDFIKMHMSFVTWSPQDQDFETRCSEESPRTAQRKMVNRGKITFLSLPAEILIKIMKFLDSPASLTSLTLSHRRLYQLWRTNAFSISESLWPRTFTTYDEQKILKAASDGRLGFPQRYLGYRHTMHLWRSYRNRDWFFVRLVDRCMPRLEEFSKGMMKATSHFGFQGEVHPGIEDRSHVLKSLLTALTLLVRTRAVRPCPFEQEGLTEHQKLKRALYLPADMIDGLRFYDLRNMILMLLLFPFENADMSAPSEEGPFPSMFLFLKVKGQGNPRYWLNSIALAIRLGGLYRTLYVPLKRVLLLRGVDNATCDAEIIAPNKLKIPLIGQLMGALPNFEKHNGFWMEKFNNPLNYPAAPRYSLIWVNPNAGSTANAATQT